MKQLDLFSIQSDSDVKEVKHPQVSPPLDIKEELRQYDRAWTPKKKFIDIPLEKLRERTYHGWLLPMLYQVESMITGRWLFWTKANKVKIESLAELYSKGLTEKFLENNLYCHKYPEISFNEQDKVLNYLYSVLSIITKTGVSLQDATTYFVDWLLYGFGHEEFTTLPELKGTKNIESELYQYFDLFPFLYHPADYFNPVMAEVFPVKQNQEKGFFPTPMTVCTAMNKILNPHSNTNIQRMNEPCAGTGSLILAYSNSGGMCLFATELQNLVLKCCLVNLYLYCPQYARPIWYLVNDNYLLWGNTLSLETFLDFHGKYRDNIKNEFRIKE